MPLTQPQSIPSRSPTNKILLSLIAFVNSKRPSKHAKKLTILAIERSILPVRITTPTPRDKIPTMEMVWKRFIIFRPVRNFGLIMATIAQITKIAISNRKFWFLKFTCLNTIFLLVNLHASNRFIKHSTLRYFAIC